MHYCQIQHNFRSYGDLCKLGKKYLNVPTCKFVSYSLQHSETFDISHAFPPGWLAIRQTIMADVLFYKPTDFSIFNWF